MNMPGFYTHYLCGREALEKISSQEIANIIVKHRQLYNLGLQGPDIFFFYFYLPSAETKKVKGTGSKMHAKKVASFFSCALKYISERETSEREALLSYLCGYACHYSLDCNTHPYIFYKTGFVRKGEKHTSKYVCYHRLFETTIDFLMVSEKLGCKPAEINGRSLIRLDSSEYYTVGCMYRSLLKDVMGIDISVEQVQRAAKEIGIAMSLFRDRTGLKRKLVYAVESVIGKYHPVSSMVHPLKLNDSRDYLNRQKAVWSLPWDIDAKSDSSFIEMFDSASSEAAHLCDAIYNCVIGNISPEKAVDIIGNRSFSTGLDCDKPLEFKYYDCIFE
ncbi:hypothetical protein CDQ83_19615 [Clostridium thermosuccinogenes]|nr:hypothetical protein CDQ83_19615 [Pseudoclostridium thermosuccinogenes]